MAFTPFTESDQPTMAAFNEKFQECIQAAENMIETGSYVGDGNNVKTITFSTSPLFLFIYQGVISLSGNSVNPGTFFLLWAPGITRVYPYYSGSYSSRYFCDFEFSQNALTMTGSNESNGADPYAAMNASGETYYYVAIGKAVTT